TPGGIPPEFMGAFLPWLAEALDRDLLVASSRKVKEERYFVVPSGADAHPFFSGDLTVPRLYRPKPDDFTQLVAVRVLDRRKVEKPFYEVKPPADQTAQVSAEAIPREPLTVGGALSAAPTGFGAFAVPVWLGLQYQSPYLTPITDDSGEGK